MATKTLSISEKAYNILKKLKKEGESFSSVIERFGEKKGDPEEILMLIEKWNNEETNDLIDLANAVETVYNDRTNRSLREVTL